MRPKIVTMMGEEARTEDGAYPEVVRVLKEALEEALRGEIVSVALFTVHPNQNISTTISQSDVGRHMLIAGVAHLMNDLLNDE